jgi:hypothetical protein
VAIRLPARLPLATIRAGTLLWRVHRETREAVWFGVDRSRTPMGRFDAPAHEFGVCYFGDGVAVAVLETVVRARQLPLVPRAELATRVVSQVMVGADLRVAQLEGAGLPVLGVDAGRLHAGDYAECQRLALDVYRHPDEADGIQYRSRWDNSLLCWALFDRAADRLAVVGGTLALGDERVSGPVLDRYRIGIL